jgi:hypothetical protein
MVNNAVEADPDSCTVCNTTVRMGGSVVVVGTVLVVVVLDVLVVVVLDVLVVVVLDVLFGTAVVGTVEAADRETGVVEGTVVRAGVPPPGNEGPAGLALALT